MAGKNFLPGEGERLAELRGYRELLAQVPGYDPARFVHDGYMHLLPQRGWLVQACLCPKVHGVITVTRYYEPLELSDMSDNSKIGEVRASFVVQDYDQHHMIYETPWSPTRNIPPAYRTRMSSYVGLSFEDFMEVPLDDGARILEEARPMEAHRGLNGDITMVSHDMSHPSADTRLDNFRVCRCASLYGDLIQIIGMLHVGVGMTLDDSWKALEVFERRQANARPELW